MTEKEILNSGLVTSIKGKSINGILFLSIILSGKPHNTEKLWEISDALEKISKKQDFKLDLTIEITCPD